MIAVFDIGKTNKKFFVFDENLKEVYNSYTSFEEIEDEDGFPCEDLNKLSQWMKETLSTALTQYDIQALNFSTYGASLVQLDSQGEPICPLYNYLKPYPNALLEQFFEEYSRNGNWEKVTATPRLGMLNAGLQNYWLKYIRPQSFNKISKTLFFPQYCHFIFTQQQFIEFTSIGCHTGLWDFEIEQYHRWVEAEGMNQLFPELVPTKHSVQVNWEGENLRVGVGIHDSSSALLPYIKVFQDPFLLVSTGTWSITLNPFNNDLLTQQDLDADCLNFLRVDGKQVRAARLFLGNEYKIQVNKLQQYFEKPKDHHKSIQLNLALYESLNATKKSLFHFESLKNRIDAPSSTHFEHFKTFEEAYHQLMIELVDLQLQAIKLAMGSSEIRKIFIDGGFIENDIYIKLLTIRLPEFEITTSQTPLGSALGAAMLVHDEEIEPDMVLQHFNMQQHQTIKI